MDEQQRIEQKHPRQLRSVFWPLAFGIDNFKHEIILTTEVSKPILTLLNVFTTSLNLWFLTFIL